MWLGPIHMKYKEAERDGTSEENLPINWMESARKASPHIHVTSVLRSHTKGG